LRDEIGDLFTDCHSILAKVEKLFLSAIELYGFNDVRQTQIHAAEPLVLEPSAFEFQMATENLKTHISPGNLVAHIVGGT